VYQFQFFLSLISNWLYRKIFLEKLQVWTKILIVKTISTIRYQWVFFSKCSFIVFLCQRELPLNSFLEFSYLELIWFPWFSLYTSFTKKSFWSGIMVFLYFFSTSSLVLIVISRNRNHETTGFSKVMPSVKIQIFSYGQEPCLLWMLWYFDWILINNCRPV